MDDRDIVVIEGYGRVTRKQARDMVIERSTQTGSLVAANKLPGGYMELTMAALMASLSPAHEPYVESIQPPPWPLRFFD